MVRKERITVTLNGERVTGDAGMTILALAEKRGIDIPTLCYHADLAPIGACRICVVEVAGSKSLAGACHTPISEGMEIETDSPKVIGVRKTIVELLLASHSGDCLVCSKANVCELRKLAAELGIGVSRFASKKRFYPLEEECPWFVRDMTKCILCYRCIEACKKLAEKGILIFAYRGFKSKVVSGTDVLLCDEACKACEECVKVCPVGALSKPDTRFRKKREKPFIITK
jgi:NADH dehydrogenase/NADH:ubiquinone oxidoreductase subunit G